MAPQLPLTPRERRVLLLFANGITEEAVGRIMLLRRDQVKYSKKVICEKLGAKVGTRHNMTLAVATAWKLCLIEADEIERGMNPDDVRREEAFLSFDIRSLPPVEEEWPQLRERCRRIAARYRASDGESTLPT